MCAETREIDLSGPDGVSEGEGWMDAAPKGCIYCEEDDISPNVECWEEYGVIVCDDCADQCHEDNGQFGVGA